MSASSVGATDQLAHPARRPGAAGRRGAARPLGRSLARDQPQQEGGRRRTAAARASSCSRSSRARSRPTTRARRSSRRRSARPGITCSARRPYGQDIFSQLVWGTRLSLVIALAVGATRHGPRGPRRRLGGLPRRGHRRIPLARHRRDPRPADLPADHRDRRLREERRPAHADRRARGARLVVRRPAAPLADAVAPAARLPRVGARARGAEART